MLMLSGGQAIYVGDYQMLESVQRRVTKYIAELYLTYNMKIA